jgi:hypothetical protein
MIWFLEKKLGLNFNMKPNITFEHNRGSANYVK